MSAVGADERQQAQRATALKELGLVLDGKGFRVRINRPIGGPAFLRVANPAAGGLSENVTCKPGCDDELFYFYSWGDPITPVSEMESAAERLMRVLSPLEVA